MPRYSYDERAGRYRDARGRFTARTRVALDDALDSSATQARTLTESLQAGTLNLAEWEAGMMREIKMGTANAYALARGGWDQMRPADWLAVGRRCKEQYTFLRSFSADIRSGKQPLDGRVLLRAEQYAKSAREFYHQTLKRERQLRGYDERRNVLHPADHCPDCVTLASLGFVPLDDARYIEIGQRQCRHNDRCTEQFRISTTGEVAA